LTLWDTDQIQRHDHKNTARMLHLWHYFMEGAAGKKIAYNSFYSSVLSNFLKICGHNSDFAVEPQNSV